MVTIHTVLRELLQIPGATYACAAARTGDELLAETGAEPVDPAVVVRWARSAADFLAAADDELDDLMVTSRRSYRLVRPVDAPGLGPLLLVLCLDRARANLAVARRELAQVRLEDGPPAQGAPPAQAPAPAAMPQSPPPTARAPLPRRVPSAIPPAPSRAPQVRTRWPALASPGTSSLSVPAARATVPQPRGGAVLPVPRAGTPPRPEPPVPHEVGPPAAPAPRWADDVGTMRRLLAGLRSMR
ncbi:hypothetical protein I4I73_26210 [Pseudonocardia sp. KRD-184]|uniref:Uncharacterized protein n=1 Tax=Pseudonocardia oceani TaxID=2792013 RepID=A0ABS6UJB8_9PSEU|nr:hypothetical protein [Pseudonocardia oceani]MBW0092659.1 hypothetical protein [Pseudonocardia oceani]MBW0099495.1 hypothetical protein [Pseudonocardia oceani]MBW0112048.1 hypothetical protein [Pseudonocardia oceani]MBW0121284.1 hypothetical protein [Pseudonocardia oceani]MBW0132342.1 hypothetical protein [Pseudonocardia oceani]